MPPTRVALVTGGTKGVGYCLGKQLLKRIPSIVTFMSSRKSVEDYYPIIGMEEGAGARKRARFITMDISDKLSVIKNREDILKSVRGLDILVNNAGIFQRPDLNNFPKQCKQILATNYWGTKNVISAFRPHFNQNCRIVNITSHLAHVMSNPGTEEMKLKRETRDRLAEAGTAEELDVMVNKFMKDAERGCWRSEGWPSCGFSVSKMAINAFTR